MKFRWEALDGANKLEITRSVRRVTIQAEDDENTFPISFAQGLRLTTVASALCCMTTVLPLSKEKLDRFDHRHPLKNSQGQVPVLGAAHDFFP